jgi:geranylgeranyl pyrophosphate synthase
MTSATASVAAIVRAAGPHVPVLLGRVEERLAELAAGHGPVLAAHAGATISAGGKRLRPLLVLLAAGPDAPRTDHVIAAATAVELVHSATLVHDDVLDAAALRRGVPTVWATGGRAMATATGDLLFSRAFSELVATGSLEAVRTLSHAGSALAEGELRQREDAWNGAVTIERYLYRCELKTARLFEASCRLGALAAGADARTVEALADFGRRIGLAFQILDDVLDVSGDPERTGKHRGTDLLDGTVTLPLILARMRHGELSRIDLRAITTPERAAAVCMQIMVTGATADATARALDIVAEAKRELALLELEESQRVALDLVADSVVNRRA